MLTRFIAFLLLIMAQCGANAAQTPPDNIIGELITYQVRHDENLYDIARNFGVGIDELMYANKSLEPWFPEPGSYLVIPLQHILPPAPHNGIVINKVELRLYHFTQQNGAQKVLTFPVSVGKPGYETPLGTTTVYGKKEDPYWTPTPIVRAEYPELGLPATVPPGPNNPLGKFAVYLGWKWIVLHGTNDPWAIGSYATRGCIRMYPEHIETLFPLIKNGTTVKVIDEQIKIGWLNSQLYLAVYPSRAQKDRIDLGKQAGAPRNLDATKRNLVKLSKDYGIQIDWDAVDSAVREYRGIPVRISQ